MTAELDRGLAALRIRFAAEIKSGAISHIGTYGGCRRKNHRPGAAYSEHSWPGGNAADVHVRTNALGDRVAAWMRSRPDLWSEVFWEIFLHWDHVHGTANPRKNYDNQQIPPCASGQPQTPEGDLDMLAPCQHGDKGDHVRALQVMLTACGLDVGEHDGVYGDKTSAGVLAMRKSRGSGATSGDVFNDYAFEQLLAVHAVKMVGKIESGTVDSAARAMAGEAEEKADAAHTRLNKLRSV